MKGKLSEAEILRIVKAAWPEVVQRSGLSARARAALADSRPTRLDGDGLRVQAPRLDLGREGWESTEFLEEALELILADLFGGQWWVEIKARRVARPKKKGSKKGSKTKRGGRR